MGQYQDKCACGKAGMVRVVTEDGVWSKEELEALSERGRQKLFSTKLSRCEPCAEIYLSELEKKKVFFLTKKAEDDRGFFVIYAP